MKLVVGLGNPGRRYARTRHNVGSAVVERLGERWSVALAAKELGSIVGHGAIHHERAVLVCPQAFMNRSGQPGASILGYNGVRMLNPSISDKASLRWTRIFVPVVASVSLLIALRFEVIYNLMVAAWTLLLVSNFVPYASGFFWKKANSSGAMASMIGGFLGWIAGFYYYLPITSEANTDVVPGVEGVYQEWANWDAIYIGSIWGVIASIVLMVVVSLATQKSMPPKPLLNADGDPLDMHRWSGLLPSRG